MIEKKTKIESLIKYDERIEKQNDSNEKHVKKNSEVLKEILLNSTLNNSNTTPDIDTLLNIIVPPLEYDENGKNYIHYVSHLPSSREDVINLQKLLDKRLIERQAKDHGICPIREELHSQCFDEILRQVTIECPERGLLLMRVRDEMKMTISAYQTLYKSAVAFGMRKQIESEKGKSELRNTLEEMRQKKELLIKKKEDLLNKKVALEEELEEKKSYERNKRKQEIEFLEYQNQHLKQFFHSIESAK